MNHASEAQESSASADDEEVQGIPWQDMAFSCRMLKIHLSQDNDWASRRMDVIDRQVDWLQKQLPDGTNKILDLCCGPGLYVHRLAGLGHHCTGVDFSPASIDYARECATQESLDIDYRLEDVRQHEYGDSYDLVMMVFGEFNQFDKDVIKDVLQQAAGALREGGLLLLEVHTFEEVRRQGLFPPQCTRASEGLFSDEPHFCLQTQQWNEKKGVASTQYVVMDEMGMQIAQFHNMIQSYTDTEYRAMLASAGIENIRRIGEAEWPVGGTFKGKLKVYLGTRVARYDEDVN